MDNSKVRKLYDAMSAKYNMTQPYEEFESLLNDEGKRRKVYDAMSAEYNMTQSFDEFNNSLMGNTVDEAVQSNQESINSITPAVGQEAVSPFQADSSYLTEEDKQTIADTAKMSWKEAKKLGQAAMGIAGQRPTADSSQAAADFINTNREAAMQQEETQKLNRQRKTEAAEPIAEAFRTLSEDYKEQAKKFREESLQLERDYFALTQAARDYATSKYGPQPAKLSSEEGWYKAYMEYLEGNDPNKVYERYNNSKERVSRDNTVTFLSHMANQTERRARQTLRQAERGVVGNTIAGVGYGISQPGSWSLGMSDLWTAENVISLANKLKDGERLTDYEQAALDAYGTYQEAASILHEYDTRGFKAGVTTGEMAPFMVQMAFNPAGKLGTTLAQKGVRKAVMNAAKGSSREAAEAVAEEAMKKYGTMATRDLLRNYGVDGAMARIPIAVRKMGGDLAASAVLANTLQVGSTLNDIAERKYGAPVLDGEHYTFDPEQEKLWAEAAYKGELSSIIENFTEMMGEWRVLGLADKMSNFGTKGVGRLVRAMGDTDFAKGLGKVLQDAHWSGTIGEMLEEEYGIILNSLLTGDSNISDLWNLDQQIDIFLGVGLFGGVMGGAKMAAYPLAYVNSKKKLDEVTNYNQDNIADWAKIQDAIDNADNNGLAGIIGSTLRDREEGKDNGRAEAILNYIDALQHFRGVTIARDMLPADADMKTMQAFYLQGYDGTDKQAVSAAYQHRKSQMELMNPGITAILDSEGIDVTIKDENGNIVPLFEGQYRQMALDYLDAKAAYDGMLDGITDRAQSKARAAEVIVRSNDNNGQQIEATTRTGDKVHIISGDVIMADGVANLDQSSKSIVIRHEDGTKEMVSPLFIKSIDLTTDTESAAAMAAQSAAQESVMTESQEAEISNADEGMQAMADNELGQQRGKEQADYQIDDIITLPDGTTGRVNLGIGQTEDGTVEVVWNTPDGNKVGRYTADQLYDMQHPEGTTAAAAQTEQVEATQENTEPTPQQQAYDEWVAKHGDNALNKLNQTRAYAEKELAARQKELDKVQSELNDLPDVEDEAITKKKSELEKKQTELQSAIGNYSATLDRMNAIQSVYDAQNQESAAEQKDVAIRNRAAEWEKNTGVKVIILERPEDVPNELARQKIEAGENVKGWFEKGQVYMYLPNNTGTQDFDQTFIHEVIAHKGLKEMLGTQLYAKLCRQVWDQLMTEEQKQEYLALVGHVEGEQAQQLAAADEFIAYFAEKMTLNPTAEDMTTWQQFVKMLTELLNKVFGTQITEQDLSELLIDSLTRYQMQVKSQEAKVRPKKAPKKKVKKVNKPTDFQNMRKAIEDVIDEMDFETQVKYAASKLGHSIVWGNDPNTETKGLGSHIIATKGGASEQDRRKYFAWEKSRRNGGKYPEEIAESIMANMPESLTEGYDTRDALRIILDAITGSSSPSDVVHQVYDDLIARQEAAEREEEEKQQYAYAKERGFGSYEELVIFDANEDLVPLSEEEWQQYYNSYYEEGTDGSSTQGVQGVVQQPAGQGENLSGGNEVGSEQRSAKQVPSNGRTEAQEGSNPVLPGTEGRTGVIQGLEGYSLQDIQDIILNHIGETFQGEFPEGFQINGIGIIGSRANGTAREDSDLDVLLEYEGDISEDALYNMLNGENGLEIEGIKIDINPITPGKSGTIQEFLERNNDYKKDDTQKEAERRDERRQRILKNGTGFEKPFVLSMPRHITTIEEIQRNIGHIIDGLIQHEGDGTLRNFEGFAADGKYSRNAGEQIREYLLSLDGVIPGRLLQLWANSNNLKTYDDIVAYGKKLYEERKKKSEFEREQLPLILEDIGGDQKLAQLMTNDEVADFVRLYESLAPYADAIGEAYEKYDKDLKSNNKKVQAAARKKIDALKKQQEDAFMATLAGVYDSLLKKYGLKEGLTDEQVEAIAFVEGKTPDQIRKEYGEEVEGETPRNTSLDEVLFRIDVNHNSPYLLKKADGAFVDPITGERLGFDNRFMGSGQGSQAHGYGSYFSVKDLREYGGKDQPRNTNAGDGLTMHSINVTDQMKKDVMEGQTMFRIGDNEKTHEMNDKQKQPGENYEIEDEVRFRLSKNNRKTIESWLNKRTDLGEGERQSTLSYIDGLDDSKTQLATGWWFAKGTIRLPEDMPKVEQAVAVSTIAKVDPLNYSSPMELINAHADIQVKDKPINPDEVSTLHKYRELPDGIVVYDVDDSEESRKNMRAIIDTHFGKESSPWCLLQGDGEGNLTEQSKDYWDYYNSYPKQVAFKDGKLQAFSANNGPRRWWDRMDKSHEGIPVEGKMPGDKLGRSAVMEYDPVDGTATVVGDMWKGNPDNGPFETYYDTGELRSRSTRKNHEDVGLVEKWHKNGQKSAEFTNNELGRTDGPAKTWHANGQLSGQGRFRNGYTEGVWESWYENGQKKLREVYPEDILSVSPENRYNQVGPYEKWYENGNKKQYVPIGEDGRVDGTVTNWFEDGTKESEEVRVDSNTRSFIRWFQSGDLEKKQEWDEDGHKTGTWESYRWDWNSNKSVLQERTTYKNGSKNGPDEEYYPNGNIKIRVNFKDGRAEGLTERWNEDGKPFLRLVRIDGKEIGHEYYDYDKNEVAQLYTMRDGAGVPHNYVKGFPMEGYKPLTEEELSTYPDWAREKILADQTMFRVGEEQLNLFSPEDMNGGIAGSQKNINFASNKKNNERGESDIQRKGSPGRADSTGRREDGISQTATSEPAQQSAESVIKPLRKLEEGEICHVERKLSEAGDFSFIGKDKIETIEDVAFIFRKLETKAVENAFIAFVKNGKATILHVGMGPIAASLVDLTPVTVMMKNINPDKVYFIHNHPSGQLTSSNPDRQLWRAMKSIMGDKLAPGIIIDTTKGKYGMFEGDAGFNDTEEFTENSKGEQQIPVYRFDERVFSKDYDPESSQIRTSRDIAAFVAGHRLGERDKISVLCLDHNSRILGNFFLPYTDFSSNDKIRKIAVDSAYYAGMCGATAIVLYGNGVDPSATNLPSLASRTLKEFFTATQFSLLDIVGCYREDNGYYFSYADHGYVAEPGADYGKREALEQAEAETDTNPTEGQKEAGNYKKGHVRLFGMNLSIEQPKGSVRSGTDADGKKWSQEMHNTYGYIRGTMGRDKDHIDVFLGDNLNSDKVFVVDQRNIKDGSFDEHKVMLGFDDIDAARKAYESNYEKGWRGMAAITETTLDDFKEWAFADGRRVQPFSQLVKTNQAGSTRKTDAAYAEYDRTRTHGIIAQSVNDEATLEDIGKLLKESKEGSPEYDVYNTIYTLAASGLSVREAKDTVINESANATESIAERRMEQDLAPVMEPLTQLAGVSFRISREPSRVRSEYNNGDIVVYNPKSAADVQAAVMRESYTHKDIRNVPGWDALTDAAYRLSEGEIASKAVRGNMDFEAATEEWMYENAERMVAPFEVMMSRNRVNLLYRMTGDEIRMYLTKSDGLLGDAELFVTKEELPVEEGVRFRRGSSTPPSSAQQLYDASQQSLANKIYRAYVDYTKPLRDLQEIIAKVSGTPIQDFENAWEAENQRSSKSKNEIEQFELRYYEKIREAVRALEKKTGMTYNEVLNYLIAKHGLERNVVLAQRDAEADYRDYLKEQPGGPMTVNDFFLKRRKRDYSGLTDLSGKQDVADAEDYARTLVQTVESMASRETDALWQTIKDAVEVIQKKRYQSGMISREQMQKEADMFDNYIPLRGFAETIAEDVYDYYEDKMRNRPQYSRRAAGRSSLADDPLATLGAMAASAIRQGNNNLMKQRFLNMVENHKTDIATIKDVWVVNHGTPSAPVWEPEYPDIHEGMDADDIRVEIEKYTNRMQQMQRVGLARKATNRLNIKWRTLGQQAKQHIITVRRNGEEQMIIINGNPQVARTVNGLNNPDADLSNFMRGVREVLRFMAANFTTRDPVFWVKNLCRDLIFAVMAVRAKENAAYRHQFMKNITGPVIKTTKIGKLLRKWQAGTLDVNNELERYFGEFMDNGGETGYTAENTVDAFRKKMMKGLKDKSKAIKAAEATLEFFELCNRSVEDLTRFTAYMTSRQMGRTVQRSVADAKNITVNFNRKGSGEMLQKYIASGYLFFNAGVQSLQNVAKISGIELSMDETKGKARIKIDGKKLSKSVAVLFGSQVIMGMVIPMLNELMMGLWGGDDDDEAMVDEDGGVISTNPYRRLTEYERRNNLCLWIGGNRFIKIPLAIELRAFYGLGETIYGYMAGIPNPNPGADILAQIADLLPVNFVENSGLVPDAAAPLWQSFITNENFMGIPLYNDSEYLKNEPEANKVYSNTGDAYIALSRWINELGGGDEVSKSKLDGKWNNPAVMQNIVEGYLGGLLTTSRQTANLIGQPIKKFILGKEVEPIPARDWPVVNSLYINTNKRNDDRYIKERYYNYRDQAEKVRHDIRKYEERLDDPKFMEKYQQLLESPEYLDYITFDALNKAVEDAHQDVKEYGDEFKVFETDAMRELVNAMDEYAEAVMQPEQWGRSLSGKDKNISE